jgi:hypothetical protein
MASLLAEIRTRLSEGVRCSDARLSLVRFWPISTAAMCLLLVVGCPRVCNDDVGTGSEHRVSLSVEMAPLAAKFFKLRHSREEERDEHDRLFQAIVDYQCSREQRIAHIDVSIYDALAGMDVSEIRCFSAYAQGQILKYDSSSRKWQKTAEIGR